MSTRLGALVTAVGILLLGNTLPAQVVEEDDTEFLTPATRDYRPTNIPDRAEAAKQIMALTNRFTHQVCRLRELAFRWPDAKTGEQIVQPHHGDRFVVTKEGESLQLPKE